MKTLGLLFESLAIRDLRVYASAHYAEVSRYKDATDLEVEAIVYAGVNQWVAAEVKLGGASAMIDKAAANLLKFADRVDTQSTGKPAAVGDEGLESRVRSQRRRSRHKPKRYL
jgi:hypothetical protein